MDNTAERPPKSAVAPLNRPKIFSHGTLECRSFRDSRPFYEEFLGLDCVRHAQKAMMLRNSSGICWLVSSGKSGLSGRFPIYTRFICRGWLRPAGR